MLRRETYRGSYTVRAPLTKCFFLYPSEQGRETQASLVWKSSVFIQESYEGPGICVAVLRRYCLLRRAMTSAIVLPGGRL